MAIAIIHIHYELVRHSRYTLNLPRVLTASGRTERPETPGDSLSLSETATAQLLCSASSVVSKQTAFSLLKITVHNFSLLEERYTERRGEKFESRNYLNLHMSLREDRPLFLDAILTSFFARYSVSLEFWGYM